MLAAEHPEEPRPLDFEIDLHDATKLLKSLRGQGDTIILECETKSKEDSRFEIGRILAVGESAVDFASYDGLGVWNKEIEVIPLKDLTRVQIATPYALTFSKYLAGPCPFVGPADPRP